MAADKQQRFVQLLQQAHEPRELSETYLVELQNATIDNPLALQTDLREETRNLERYDEIYQATDARYDIRGSDLAKLVMMCLSQQGRLSQNRRKQYRYRVPEEALDFIESEAQRLLLEDSN